MTTEEALKIIKNNSTSANKLIETLNSRVENIKKNIEFYRSDISELEKKIKQSEDNLKEDTAILEALKVLVAS